MLTLAMQRIISTLILILSHSKQGLFWRLHISTMHFAGYENYYLDPMLKNFTVVNYDSRVVSDWKIPHIMYDPRVIIYQYKMFIRLVTVSNV